MAIQISVTDNSQEVLDELKKRIAQGLNAIGVTAEKHAKANCPVDTGRLRNSITYAVTGGQGSPNTEGGQAAKPSDYAKHAEPEYNEVVVGTNVEYAARQELYDYAHHNGRAHFIRDSLATHGDDFKKLMEAALKD